MNRTWDYWILWIIVLALAAGNFWLAVRLLEVQRDASTLLQKTSDALTAVGENELPYTINIDEQVPFNAKVDLRNGIRVPVNTSVPLDTVVDVPVSFPLIGQTIVRVPVHTTVPINLTLDLKLDQEVPVSGQTSLKLAVPLQIGDTPLGETLTKIAALLRDLQKELESSR